MLTHVGHFKELFCWKFNTLWPQNGLTKQVRELIVVYAVFGVGKRCSDAFQSVKKNTLCLSEFLFYGSVGLPDSHKCTRRSDIVTLLRPNLLQFYHAIIYVHKFSLALTFILKLPQNIDDTRYWK